ncbi:hypothetical protein Lfu02_72940 [Longispora fulva]|uniref:non-specific serine/threonine protein kinase n=1 Tax=Longispora fulva TaxID=619741 RepID=A0A8J7G6L9_9ACTN|nr:serine/threonine-protein kinase [Longispora fulva]MBG6133880.1 serine/threonine-protein kinase [Longispora fulva]GIG62922.1 hypothetical protein Lfu02_72940 [Longispora fulva]
MLGALINGRYRLTDRIAVGGMGQVWRATDLVLDRTVAVKLLRAEFAGRPGFGDRFRAEARLTATIRHPGVVRIHDYGELDGAGYLVMEFVEGESLAALLDRVGTLEPARTMELLAQAAEALAAAHRHGIIHRDIKPANLLIRADGGLVLTDFGIAHAAGTDPGTTLGDLVGTASYLAPEQATGDEVTPAADLYSLGVVGYRCLTGNPPFTGDNPIQIAVKHIQASPAPLPVSVPAGVREVVERAMRKAPGERYADATAFAVAARKAGDTPAGRSGHLRLRTRFAMAAAVVVASALVAGAQAWTGGRSGVAGPDLAARPAALSTAPLSYPGAAPTPGPTPSPSRSAGPSSRPSTPGTAGSPEASATPSRPGPSAGPTLTPTPSPSAPPVAACAGIKSFVDDWYLDLYNNQLTDGNQVLTYIWSGSTRGNNQRFCLHTYPDGTTAITPMDAPDTFVLDKDTHSNRVQLWHIDGGRDAYLADNGLPANEKWWLRNKRDGWVQLVSVNTGECLTNTSANGTPGQVTVTACTESTSQYWKLNSTESG